MILQMVRMSWNEGYDLLLEIGITVDILRDIFLGRLNESLLGEHALHGVVEVLVSRIVSDESVCK